MFAAGIDGAGRLSLRRRREAAAEPSKAAGAFALIRRITSCDEDAAVLLDAANGREVAKGVRLRRGEAGHLSLLCDGFAKSIRVLPQGEQQTVALFMNGDLMGGAAFVLGRSRATTIAITRITVLELPFRDLRTLVSERPTIGFALWRRMMQDFAVQEEWLVGLGRRPALARTAHLLCEVLMRSGCWRDGDMCSCAFPLSQSELADILGLSPVHVNRVLQRLRSQGVVELSGGRLCAKSPGRLAGVADFDGAYIDRGAAASE